MHQAVEILKLAAKTPNLVEQLVDNELEGWRGLNVPVDNVSRNGGFAAKRKKIARREPEGFEGFIWRPGILAKGAQPARPRAVDP
jgi:hypothetical protein